MRTFISIALLIAVFEGGDTAGRQIILYWFRLITTFYQIFLTFKLCDLQQSYNYSVLVFKVNRCGGPRFNCAKRNPCTSPVCGTSTTYPGKSLSVYVQCGAAESCEEIKCPRRQVYSEAAGGCVRKT